MDDYFSGFEDNGYNPGAAQAQPRRGRGQGRRGPIRNQQNRANDGLAWRNKGNTLQPRQPRGHALVQQRGFRRGQGQVFFQNQHMPNDNMNRQHPDINQDRNTENMRRNDRQHRQTNRNDAHNDNGNQRARNRLMGFRALQEIAQADSREVIVKINDRKEAFMSLLESTIDEDKLDMVVLIMDLIAKVCNSSFDELKQKLLLDICNNTRFIITLRDYLLELPYVEQKIRNKLYWENQHQFWQNFATFCQCIVDISPATALNKCRSLIERTSKCCLEGLNERHGFTSTDEYCTKMEQLKERLTFCEKEDKIQSKENKKQNLTDEDSEPPEDFRQLCIVPDRDDLLGKRPFLRPNIIAGGYRDVEHYLDVQFRLLREDCLGPLRNGLLQYMKEPNNKKFDNIRVFRNVKFVEPYISKTKIGSTIQIDEQTTKRFKKINWAHSKRFIFGSLLLFTKDNCRSFITATILDRDTKLLTQGKVPVSIVGMVDDNLYNDDSYIMIESEIYFEPYYHVLKALQDPKFPEHIAMKKYIVYVDREPNPPAYLRPEAVFNVQTQFSESTKFRVLQESTWPTKEELGLNASQYEAYHLALTHEFAVIQGPPGTGKTFLGVKVAKTLINNLTPKDGACLMLVICYTNHALDQFLEEILPVTKSIVRIGGQSRSEAMEQLNLTNLRRTAKQSVDYGTNKLFFQQRDDLRNAVLELQQAQKRLDSLNNGVLSYSDIQKFAPESRILGQYYAIHKPDVKSDPLKHWLFENMQHVVFQNVQFDEENENQEIEIVNDMDDNIYERNKMILDDFEEDDDKEINLIADKNITTSFSVINAENKLKSLSLLYNRTEIGNGNKQLELQRDMVDWKSRIALFTEMTANRTRVVRLHLNDGINPSTIPMADRWALYFRWANIVINKLKLHMKPLQAKIQSATTAYEESRMMVDLKILRGITVIGMTTSGAARLRKLLQELAAPIVIVEEAAEVLEQHIITSLTKDCEHLILIGDHQQLRPSAAHMVLARRFNIEVSLFERMITNGIHSRRLAVQHRMRPEFAALISPHIYQDLANHPSVDHFPSVRGVTDNLFFLTHDFKEEKFEDGSSKSNYQEADIALRLANYLMQQGYEGGDVTVLAAYSGQMFYMRKQRDRYTHLSKVKITVLDNYQGEESKIIILSLVRNNLEDNIGFLGTENRICVALSRAREGFYILGNIDILKRKSELWKKIAVTLQTNASLGTALMLKCSNHPGQITTISSAKDFDKVPEGGCLLKCNFNLPCGHRCPLVCHGYDRGHVNTKCHLKCERILCELGHVCPQLCWVKCQPCNRLVEKTLPCGHKMLVNCHMDPADPIIKCLTTVTVKLPACGHETKKSCHMDIASVRCAVRCVYRVDKCGHECRLKCHVNDDPDHERYLCEKPCAKAKNGCTAELIGDRGDHQCPKKCHENCDYCTVEVNKKRTTCNHLQRIACYLDANETPCRKNCSRMLPCGHHCKKKCYEQCGDCKQKVTKTIPDCQHDVKVICMQVPTRELCKNKCERILPCGHHCTESCSKVCNPDKCTELIPSKFVSPCGHHVNLPCNIYGLLTTGAVSQPEILLQHCTEPCNAELACGHRCSGSCSRCHQGRLHAACTQTCHQTIICGHQCKEPCNQVCPPCKMPCEVRCPHSRCKLMCGAPCTPCQEPCKRRCVHGACARRCGEPCSRAPCDAACTKSLPCGHRCRGLCGEPCPNICQVCRPDDFPKDFLGDEFEENDKFVQLQDCPHVLEVENMDNLMTGDRETVTIRTCPFCRKPIINTYRYKDHVNNMFKTEINPIKERVYGNEALIKTKDEELSQTIRNFGEREDIFQENPHLKKAFIKLRSVVLSQKKVSLLKLDMQAQYLNILDMVGESYLKYKLANLTELKADLLDHIITISSVLDDNIQKISQQLQMDIGNEIKRLKSIRQLSQILSHTSYLTSRTTSKVMEAAKNAKKVVLTWGIYKEKDAVLALKGLEEAVKVFGIVTKEERDLVVKAIGSKAGSWYKCPNGHFYSIADCGGAMVVSKCVDCGVAIGGTNHRLLGDNRHAGELDGSRNSAWSNEYDNMANYDLP